MSKVSLGITAVLRTLFFVVLGTILPYRAKRIFLIATLHAELVEKGVFEQETLDKLNDSMKLAQDVDALKYPAYFHQMVWSDQERLSRVVDEIVGEHTEEFCIPHAEAKKVSETIISMAPSWLRYGPDEMVSDVIHLFYCHPVRHA